MGTSALGRMGSRWPVLAAVLLAACQPFWIDRPLTGRVVDARTGLAVSGATVVYEGRAEMSVAIMAGAVHHFDPVQAETDARGEFRVGHSFHVVPECFMPTCFVGRGLETVRIFGGGYLPFVRADREDRAAFERELTPAALESIRWTSDLARYGAENEPRTSVDSTSRTAATRRFRETPTRPFAPPGVFAHVDAARFDQVVRNYGDGSWPAVLAHDQQTGVVTAWTERGDALPVAGILRGPWHRLGERGFPLRVLAQREVISSARSIQPPSEHMFDPGNWVQVAAQIGNIRAVGMLTPASIVTVEGDGRRLGLYRWSDAPDGLQPDRTIPVGDLLDGATGPVECLATSADFRDPQVILVARTATSRAIYRRRFASGGEERFEHVSVPDALVDGEVTACAASRTTLYVALRGQGIRAWPLDGTPLDPRAFWRHATGGASLPDTFTSLAASDLVYAVADDGNVYRFLADGTPDQRVTPAIAAASAP